MNPNISYLFIIYQYLLVVAALLGPTTIMLAIASAVKELLECELWLAYGLSLTPVVILNVVCFKCKTKVQLITAGVLSVVYVVVMVFILVQVIRSLIDVQRIDPWMILFVVCIGVFAFAAFIHPYEIFCLAHIFLYFLLIPTGYIIIFVYALTNLHVTCWGTREIEATKKCDNEKKNDAVDGRKRKRRGFLAILNTPDLILQEVKDAVMLIFAKGRSNDDDSEVIVKWMKKIHLQYKNKERIIMNKDPITDSSSDEEELHKKPEATLPSQPAPTTTEKREKALVAEPVREPDPDNPHWISDHYLQGSRSYLDPTEQDFWEQMIKKYVSTIEHVH